MSIGTQLLSHTAILAASSDSTPQTLSTTQKAARSAYTLTFPPTCGSHVAVQRWPALRRQNMQHSIKQTCLSGRYASVSRSRYTHSIAAAPSVAISIAICRHYFKSNQKGKGGGGVEGRRVEGGKAPRNGSLSAPTSGLRRQVCRGSQARAPACVLLSCNAPACVRANSQSGLNAGNISHPCMQVLVAPSRRTWPA